VTPEQFAASFEVLAEAPGGVKKLREMILGLALHGRLIAQDSREEPASKLLAKIAAAGGTRKKSIDQKDVDPVPSPPDELPTLPQSWGWTSIDSIADCILGKMLDKNKHTKGKERPYLRNINVRWGSFDTTNLFTMFFEDDELDRYGVKTGDVLICEGGEPGRAAVWNDTSTTMFIQKAIHRVRLKGGIVPQWLVFNLRYDTWTGRLDRHLTGATIKHFTGRALGRYYIRLAPVAEQKRIVAKVDQLMALCDELEARQAKKRDRAVRLNRAALDSLTSAEGPEELAASFRRVAENFEVLFHKPENVDELRKAILELARTGKLVYQDPRERPIPARLQVETDEIDPSCIPDGWTCSMLDHVAEMRLGKMLDQHKNRGQPRPYLRNTNVHWFRFELNDIKQMSFEQEELPTYEVLPGDVLICEGGHGIGRAAVWQGQIRPIMFQKRCTA
jgi:type I restriction enzyme, S subunit